MNEYIRIWRWRRKHNRIIGSKRNP